MRDDAGRLPHRAHRGEHLVGDGTTRAPALARRFQRAGRAPAVCRSATATISTGTPRTRAPRRRRCSPSSSTAPLRLRRARRASRKRLTSGFWRLAMRSIAVVIVPAVCYHHSGAEAVSGRMTANTTDEGAAPQEVRGRNPSARQGAEDRAAEGDQARARARRPARERRVPGGEGAAAPRRVAHQHAAEARQRDLADEPRHASRTTRSGSDRPCT